MGKFLSKEGDILSFSTEQAIKQCDTLAAWVRLKILLRLLLLSASTAIFTLLNAADVEAGKPPLIYSRMEKIIIDIELSPGLPNRTDRIQAIEENLKSETVHYLQQVFKAEEANIPVEYAKFPSSCREFANTEYNTLEMRTKNINNNYLYISVVLYKNADFRAKYLYLANMCRSYKNETYIHQFNSSDRLDEMRDDGKVSEILTTNIFTLLDKVIEWLDYKKGHPWISGGTPHVK